MRLPTIVLLAVLFAMPASSRGQTVDKPPTPESTRVALERIERLKKAESHLAAARQLLKEAAEEGATSKVVDAEAEFDLAAKEYLTYLAPDDKEDFTRRLKNTVVGLFQCQRVFQALTLILQHPEAQTDPTILHLKADALLVLGSGQEAALTYEQWMTRGECGGDYRAWPGEPSWGHPTEVIQSAKDPKDPCAHLTPEMRVRMETLQRVFGHPVRLPPKNYETSPLDGH